MLYEELQERNLERVADSVERFVNRWECQISDWHQPISEDTLHYARLAVYEWVANLIQHADFGGRTPAIVISVWPRDRRLFGIVEDNSEGFILEDHLRGTMEDRVTEMSERGMGLLMIEASTEYFRYRSLNERRHRLEFSVLAPASPEYA